MKKRKFARSYGLVGLMIVVFLCSCATVQNVANPPKLTVTPAETVLSPALIKKPVTFTGSGFEPKELVSVEMILPPGVTVKGIEPGENVGLAYGTTDDKGNLKAAMKPTATLDWFFQVGWTSNLKPDFKAAKPLPPGTYKIIATGMMSDLVGKSTLTILPPPKKKK
jgi:hypothetical protein